MTALERALGKGGDNLTATTATAVAAGRRAYGLPFVISASSAGTVIEWYDFYLYATLTPFLAPLFFPGDNPTAVLLSGFAAYAAGFLVRPFGAVVFGALGDIIGRKYTFLVTISVMGIATVIVGLLPTYAAIGIFAPVLLVLLRLAQGLALGGEYGGAAIYVAEHAPDDKRGLYTSWIQTTATVGFFLALAVILIFRVNMSAADFSSTGWRHPFLQSYPIMLWAVGLGTPFFLFFGWLSDKIGRKPIILAGCLIAAVTYLPIYHAMYDAAHVTYGANGVITKADPDSLALTGLVWIQVIYVTMVYGPI